MTDDDADLDGFGDWEEVEDLLAHEPWEGVRLDRADGTSLTLHTRYDGRLSILDSDLTAADRAALCRCSFMPRSVPGDGRCWVWAPPSSHRPRRVAAKEIVRSSELLWACLNQRDRKAIRVLRDVLGAAPQELRLHLESEAA